MIDFELAMYRNNREKMRGWKEAIRNYECKRGDRLCKAEDS